MTTLRNIENALIIGASSLVGSTIATNLTRELGNKVLCTYFKDNAITEFIPNSHFLDLENIEALKTILNSFSPSHIFVCSKISPENCFKKKVYSRKIIVNVAENINNYTNKKVNTKVIFISTDQVFNDKQKPFTKETIPKPENIFGKLMFEAENIYLKNKNNLIFRHGFVFGIGRFGSLRGMIHSEINNHKEQSLIDDSRKIYPISSRYFVKRILSEVENNTNGIVHVSGRDNSSKYKLTKDIFQSLNLDDSHLKSFSDTKSRNILVDRPSNIRLLDNKISSCISLDSMVKDLALMSRCSFELIYGSKKTYSLCGINVGQFRENIGRILFHKTNKILDADIVVPIPESGLPPAIGYSNESKIPLSLGIVKQDNIEKTLFFSREIDRPKRLTVKLKMNPSIVQNKRIILIDEAVISGSTLEHCLQLLSQAKAHSVDIRIPYPVVKCSCPYEIFKFSKLNNQKLEDYKVKYPFVRSIEYLGLNVWQSIEGLKKPVCFSCH